jgi:glycosyltransferase involved in cell wall biosynthesis
LGIRAARYPWIVRVDGDDMLLPDYLAKINRALIKNPGYDFYYCKRYIEFYSEKRQVPKEIPAFDIEEIFERGDFFATGTAYRKSDLVVLGGYQESVKNCGLENYDLILRLISAGKRGLAVPDARFKYRRHRTNMSTTRREFIVEYGKKLLKGYHRDFHTNEFHPYGLRIDGRLPLGFFKS